MKTEESPQRKAVEPAAEALPPQAGLEAKRGLWHWVVITLCGVLAGFVPHVVACVLLTLAVPLVWYLQDKWKFKQLLRPHELVEGRSAGFDFLVALAIIYFVLPTKLLQITLFMVAAADPVARMVGRAFGKTKLPLADKKTWVGSFGCFFTALLVGVGSGYILGVDWRLPFVGALVATFMEALPDRRWLLADNFRMTMGTGLAMYWLQTSHLLL